VYINVDAMKNESHQSCI